jgi:hypothetical protein
MAKRKISPLAQTILLCNSLSDDEQRVVVDLLRSQLQPEKQRRNGGAPAADKPLRKKSPQRTLGVVIKTAKEDAGVADSGEVRG